MRPPLTPTSPPAPAPPGPPGTVPPPPPYRRAPCRRGPRDRTVAFSLSVTAVVRCSSQRLLRCCGPPIVSLSVPSVGHTGEAIVLPRPTAVNVLDGAFTLDLSTTLAAEPRLSNVAGWLRGVIGPVTGCWLPPPAGAAKPGISLNLDATLPREGY